MAAAAGATHADLTLVVYDALATDLIQCAEATRKGDVAYRCASAKHAFALLGHLDCWVGLLDEPLLRSSLSEFYGMLRTNILRLQSQADAAAFEQLATYVCDTRAAWQAAVGNLRRSASSDGNQASRYAPEPASSGTLRFKA
jgi:flagellin-specific chaperone FliS